MNKMDWKNIDWSALFKSQVAIGAFVTIITSALSLAGHTISAGDQQVLVDNVTKICDGLAFFAGLYTMHARVTAQPEGQTVIVPKKDSQPQTGV